MWEWIDFINNQIFTKPIEIENYKKEKYIGRPKPKPNKQQLKKQKKI